MLMLQFCFSAFWTLTVYKWTKRCKHEVRYNQVQADSFGDLSSNFDLFFLLPVSDPAALLTAYCIIWRWENSNSKFTMNSS